MTLFEKYLEQTTYFGATIGRCANRISGASFELDGKVYKLNANEGKNQLHGGIDSFDKRMWNVRQSGGALVFSYFSAGGEEFYPGNFDVNVTFSLSDENELRIEYSGVTDSDTIVNMTNHSYFNLGGRYSGSAMDHLLMIDAGSYTPLGEGMIPTGEIRAVEGTPFDFRTLRRIGDRIDGGDAQLRLAGGYDHNFVLNGEGFRKFAELVDEKTGRAMYAYTDMPGVQLYTANFVQDAPAAADGRKFVNRSAVCLETQFFPNAVNTEGFEKPIVKAGERYEHVTAYRFGLV